MSVPPPSPPTFIGRVIEAAYQAALLGDQDGSKHGCVLLDSDDNVLSVGWNHRYSVMEDNKVRECRGELTNRE